MARAWPFENKSEGREKIRNPQDFVARLGTDGTEAIVIRIGLNDAQLVLVDGRGYWERWVFHSVDEAESVANSLGVEVHVGEYPEETRVRIGKYQPGAEHYDRAAYPEQGEIGPVIPYPENRSRDVLVEVSKKKAPPQEDEG